MAVREHPDIGVMVENMTELIVNSKEDVFTLMADAERVSKILLSVKNLQKGVFSFYDIEIAAFVKRTGAAASVACWRPLTRARYAS